MLNKSFVDGPLSIAMLNCQRVSNGLGSEAYMEELHHVPSVWKDTSRMS
jgi:hypothetical protein